MELCYLALWLPVKDPVEVLVLIGAGVIAYLLLAWLVWQGHSTPSASSQRSFVWLVIVLGVLFRLTLVPHGVVGSDDIYRYLWDGKVSAAGINPYVYPPVDPHLAHLAGNGLPQKVNNPEFRTVYPALAQLFFLLSHTLFGDSIAGLKFLLVCMDTLTMIFLLMFLRSKGSDVVPLIVYAWSPLPIVYFGLDGHVDALGIPFLIAALLLICTRRPVRGVFALGIGALAKLFPLLIVPFLFRSQDGRRRFLLPAIPVLMVAAGCMAYFDPSLGVIESLKTFGSRWEFNGSLFWIAYWITGTNEAAHIVCAIAIAGCVGCLTFLRLSFLERVFWGSVCFFLLSPVVHPWYLTWLAALLVIRWSTTVFVFLGLSNLANIVVYQYRASGQWVDQPYILLLEYVPVFVLLVLEMYRGDWLKPTIFRVADSERCEHH